MTCSFGIFISVETVSATDSGSQLPSSSIISCRGGTQHVNSVINLKKLLKSPGLCSALHGDIKSSIVRNDAEMAIISTWK